MKKYNIDNLTREDAIELHRKMWKYIARYEKKNNITPNIETRYELKQIWCEKHIEGSAYNECFLCHYARLIEKIESLRLGKSFHYCNFCPLKWTNKEIRNMRFKCEQDEIDWGTADAEIIANLPEKRVYKRRK